MKLLSKLSAFAASVPGVLVGMVFAVISSFFFTIDYEKIIGFLKENLPEGAVRTLSGIRSGFVHTSGRYLRSYALILLITFAELALGLDDRRRTETARGGAWHRAVRYPSGLRHWRNNGPVGCDTGARRQTGALPSDLLSCGSSYR